MTFPSQRSSSRPSPIFLALLAATVGGGVLAWLAGSQPGLSATAGVFIFVVCGWLVSLCLHEFGHAYTAWRFGDRDAAIRGYLTLDPRHYSNPWLSLGLPILFIALGGMGLPGAAVYLNLWSMPPRRRTLVALAGPVANLLLGVVLLFVLAQLVDFEHQAFWGGVAYLAFLQLMAVLLNLLPIPGFDGYEALEPHLSPETQRALAPAKQFGMLVLLFFFMAPAVGHALFNVVDWFYSLSGVPSQFWWIGDSLTRFWMR